MIEKSGKRYLTVREFASKAGKSNQAIYKKVDNQLSTYAITVDNRLFIDETALKEVFGAEVDNQVDNQVDNLKSAENSPNEQGQADVTKELIELLKEEIKKKDLQIEKLQQRLDHAQDLIADMAQKAQYITAADKTEKIMLQQPDQKEIIEPVAAAENQNSENKQKKKWYQFWK